jgi:putative phage-type endonuclease
MMSVQNNLQQRTAEWHSLRNGRITASAFGNALGFWKTGRIDLWEEKIGLRKPFTGNQATQWGTDQEAGAIERYRQITGNLVDSIAFKIYNEGDDLQDWLGASPDGLIDANISREYVKGGILEVKCPHNKGNPEQGVPWSAVPYYYMPQAQGLLEIFDRDWMDFYVWCLNGSAVFRIHRDPEYWTLIFRVMSEYWWGNVVPAKHLLMDGKELETIKGLRPAASHPLTDTVVTKSRLLAAQAPRVWRDIGSQRLNSEDIKIRLQDFYSF